MISDLHLIQKTKGREVRSDAIRVGPSGSREMFFAAFPRDRFPIQVLVAGLPRPSDFLFPACCPLFKKGTA
jgi:hypothetical protein